MKQIYSVILFFMPLVALSTHNRGGEITYKHLFGLTYEFTISTCTKSSSPADRPELEIDFGDGHMDTVPRLSLTPIAGYDAQKNIYVINHTFVGSGTYQICVSDPNRNDGIINVGGSISSDNVAFSIQSQLVISPFIGTANNSVTFADCPCPEYACVNFAYCYNPEAIDVDGDSLGYELVVPLDENCSPLFLGVNYTYPNTLGGGTISLNPVSGDFCWNNPGLIGEYNIAIKITEYRHGVAIGYVIRDIQITVIPGCDNSPPVIDPIQDTCVIAGTNISFDVHATDPDLGDNITLTGSGLPFTVASSPALFSSVTGPAPQTSTFSWTTNCTHVRLADYQLFFKAEDNGLPELSSTQTMNIKVLPPIPTGLTAAPLGNTITLFWDANPCSTICDGYNIYRSYNALAIPNDPCCYNPDLTPYNYELVGTVSNGSTTTFTDAGLNIGNQYCYIVTGLYENSLLESCPSDSVCSSLIQDVPIITHVSVVVTDAAAGQDSVIWAKPTELDTALIPGPYYYKVYHGTGFTTASTLVHTTVPAAFLSLADTVFVHSGINTVDDANNYRVELYATINGVPDSLVGGTNNASSVYLSTAPNDNRVILSWTEQVPWINSSYEVYRADLFGGPYVFIATTTSQSYVDSNLLNGVEYCYYVRSVGSYSVPGIVSPLLNRSQRTCETPTDLTPPCPPLLTIIPDCPDEISTLIWNNPNNSCADDVTMYTVYYSDVIGGEFSAVGIVNSATDTTFSFSNNGSIAGCYYVTATDSVQYANESDSSNVVCVDNCPIYFLPNVFTPNSDGQNDLFIPILPYKYVEDIDIQIFNRWGQVVFTSTDPMIRWDGRSMESGALVPDGVYYFICIVNTIRLSGIEPIELTGVLHLFSNTGTTNGN
jgi:gliding motility-associated-like protein